MGASPGQQLDATVEGGKRILFATIGSLGDVYPCIALGLELKRRGHAVTFATTEYYRSSLVNLGFGFHPLRPDWDPTNSELIAKCEDLKRGPEILIRDLILPHLNDTYHDLLAAANKSDIMLAGELNYAAPMIAEKLQLPWVSIILSPISFFSVHDPSFLVNAPWLFNLRDAGASVNRSIIAMSRVMTRRWWQPVRALRSSEGLRVECDPLLRDKFSPLLTLALFSKHFAEAQSDWPANTAQPGFVFYDKQIDSPVADTLMSFLEVPDQELPIVFTQGSTATHNAGEFYNTSAETARRLGKKALLVGATGQPTRLDANVLALPYVPYSWIFPRASIIVHQGGSGTTAQALRAGRPMLIIPYGWDQPDNALRVQRQGAGLHLPRAKYSVQNALAAIRKMINDPGFEQWAGDIGEKIRAENAVTASCNAIEKLLA